MQRTKGTMKLVVNNLHAHHRAGDVELPLYPRDVEASPEISAERQGELDEMKMLDRQFSDNDLMVPMELRRQALYAARKREDDGDKKVKTTPPIETTRKDAGEEPLYPYFVED